MNKILKVATVLTWFNIIFWSFVCLIFLLGILTTGATALLIVLVFFSAIVLHSYACFQLQKTLRHPSIPLKNQTSTGIRFIGFVALFLGLMMVIQGIGTMTNASAVLKQWQDLVKEMQASKEMVITPTQSRVRVIGFCSLLVGLFVAVNVNLNFRLLRWYYYLRGNSKNPEK
ncbi:MAG TPA: hypothetical protein VGM31_21780 [Puia sp.]|jgi:hypothetical protein